MALVRIVGGNQSHSPEVSEIRVRIPRGVDVSALGKALPELRNELCEQWPVYGVRLAPVLRASGLARRARRNPLPLSAFETGIIVGLLKAVAPPVATVITTRVIKWLRLRFKRTSKGNKRRTKVRKR